MSTERPASYRDRVASRFPVAPERAILSVDVEEYYNYIPDAESQVDFERVEKRAAQTLPRLLDLFDACSVRATFFVLASVVESVAPLLERVVAAGHEIASHGWSHKRVHRMTPSEFRDDIVRSRDRIEAATGVRPRGYRAPSFSMSAETMWAFDVLRDEGFTYDSSVAPLNNFFYGGVADAPPWPHRLANGLVEFPLPVWGVGPFRTLIGGGFYLRVFPLWLNRFFLWRYRRRNQCPPVIYIHPWEYDEPRYNAWNLGVDHSMLAERGRFMRWVTVHNRHKALRRFARLLGSRSWTCFEEVVG